MTHSRWSQLVLASLLFVLCAVRGSAATRIWLGSENEYLSNPANWTNGLVPGIQDSIEFPVNAKIRTVFNDLNHDIRSITFKAYDYTVTGFPFILHDGVQSLYSRATNRIECGILAASPQVIANYGYFSQLELAGRIDVFSHPLYLHTASRIVIQGPVIATNGAPVVMTDGGIVAFGVSGSIDGNVIVQQGTLVIPDGTSNQHLTRSLTIGDDTSPPRTARVRWDAGQGVKNDLRVVVNSSGVMDLNGLAGIQGFKLMIGRIKGSGVIDLNMADLILTSPGSKSDFSGVIKGTGKLRIEGLGSEIELSGHNPLDGTIEVYDSTMILSGSVSNAVVVLDNAIMNGGGLAKSVRASGSRISPGPGILRVLESLSLDENSRMHFDLDGPGASTVEAGTLDLGNSRMYFVYSNAGVTRFYTLISANTPSSSTFRGIPEGAWLYGGAAEAPNEFQITYSGNAGGDIVLESFGEFEPPRLRINRSSENRNRIVWPLSARGYALQRSPSIELSDWGDVSGFVISTSATEHIVIDEATTTRGFYRLVR